MEAYKFWNFPQRNVQTYNNLQNWFMIVCSYKVYSNRKKCLLAFFSSLPDTPHLDNRLLPDDHVMSCRWWKTTEQKWGARFRAMNYSGVWWGWVMRCKTLCYTTDTGYTHEGQILAVEYWFPRVKNQDNETFWRLKVLIDSLFRRFCKSA